LVCDACGKTVTGSDQHAAERDETELLPGEVLEGEQARP
jgi:hypothetical protein